MAIAEKLLNFLNINSITLFFRINDTEDKTKVVCKHDILCKQHCKSKTKNFKMPENAEKMTISSKNCNHVNLVKLQKNKEENTIILDIISANIFPCKKQRHNESTSKIFKFSLQRQLSPLTSSDTPFNNNDKSLGIISGIRGFSLFWIILLNTTTLLSYVSSE